jgi:hypothetical protein
MKTPANPSTFRTGGSVVLLDEGIPGALHLSTVWYVLAFGGSLRLGWVLRFFWFCFFILFLLTLKPDCFLGRVRPGTSTVGVF